MFSAKHGGPNHLMAHLPGCPGKLVHVTGCAMCMGIVEIGRVAMASVAELGVIRTENVDTGVPRS